MNMRKYHLSLVLGSGRLFQVDTFAPIEVVCNMVAVYGSVSSVSIFPVL